jgi:hypothetical protein
MHDLLFEMDWITAVRSERLTLFFSVITHLGGAVFAIVVLSLGLWWGPRKIFGRLIAISLISQILNTHLKAFYMLPRPNEIYHLTGVTESSFPSGHAQIAATMWLSLAQEIGRPWAWLVDSTIVAVVAASRVYLGVHFGRDVVAGVMVGALMVFYFRWLNTQEGSTSRKQIAIQLLLFAIFQLAWLGLLVDTTRGRFLPTAIFAGFWIGLFLQHRIFSFPSLDMRWAAGWSGLVLFFSLPTLWSAGTTWFGPVGLGTRSISVHIQFAILGIWLALGAPTILKSMKKR